MPEGPEIRRAADKIGKALVGKVIEDGEWPFPSLAQADSLILGHEVLSVTSRAKAMLIRFSSGYTMYSHNQLYGRWTVHLKTTDPRSRRSLRAAFITDKHAVRLWSATDIVLLPTPEENGHPFLARLGPDVLDETITSTALLHHLKSKGIHRKREPPSCSTSEVLPVWAIIFGQKSSMQRVCIPMTDPATSRKKHSCVGQTASNRSPFKPTNTAGSPLTWMLPRPARNAANHDECGVMPCFVETTDPV